MSKTNKKKWYMIPAGMSENFQRGALLIHGLTGTPEVMEPVARALEEAGFIISVPLLPGHGKSPEDLATVVWQDWWNTVLEAYQDIRRRAKSVSCVGLSLGSILALRLALEVSHGVSAVAAIGTPLVLGRAIEYFAYPLVRYTPLSHFFRFQPKNWEEGVADPEGLVFYKAHSYDKIPVHSVVELFKLKKEVRGRLSEIKTPVLVLHGGKDKVAPPRNIDILKKGLKNIAGIVVLENSMHVATVDFDKEIVATTIVDFFNKFS